ncbi:MAG: Penicillin-binding protein 2 [Candidatus Anoxychlamydiales bacterium]|nr:Penicillin-binding protein 2 [Candidatus Anoxychlamydiales bacterium]
MNKVNITKKITIVLNIILIIFLMIIFKTWHLSVIQREDKKKLSDAPRKRSIIIKPNRGTIYDRASVPLAINRIKYNATIYYSHLKQIPSFAYKKVDGKTIKLHPRNEHIKKISLILAKELDLDSLEIEDLIHSKASIFPNAPFIIKENISEKTYYRLRFLQKDLLGVNAEITTQRFYPQLDASSSLIGYMGKINTNEYYKIASEIKTLKSFLEKYENFEEVSLEAYNTIEEVENRLKHLTDLSYSINDYIGKTGLEKSFEETLKGFHSKKNYIVDIQGNFLKELPGYEKPKPGKQINLTISSELQKYAEQLLAEDEKIRDDASKKYDIKNKKLVELKTSWIKGGSIIAIDPNTFEVIAMATFPIFNPNDFILDMNNIDKNKKDNINKYLETNLHIKNIFDGKKKLERKIYFKEYITEEKELSLDVFLNTILEKNSPILPAIDKINTIKNAIEIQEAIDFLLYITKSNASNLIDFIFDSSSNILINKNQDLVQNDEIKSLLNLDKDYVNSLIYILKKHLSSIPDNRDKLFTIDILKVLVFSPAFSNELIDEFKFLNLSTYLKLSKASLKVTNYLKNKIKPIFHELTFLPFREKKLKDFLKEKRKIEKEKKMFPRPYIDYLKKEENKQFDEFWQKHHLLFLTCFLKNDKLFAFDDLEPYLDKILQEKENIDEILLDDYQLLSFHLKNLNFDLTCNFFKTIRSFDDLDRPLLYNYPRLRKSKNIKLEKDLAASFYPINGYGFSKSYALFSNAAIGSIFKLVPSYCALKERYMYLKENNLSLNYLNPLTIIDDIYYDSNKKSKGLAVAKSLSNIPYYRRYKGGRLPKSAHPQIGKIDLIHALEKSSNPYFSILSSDHITDTRDLLKAAKDFSIGKKTNIDLPYESAGNLPEDILFDKTSLYSFAIGQHSLIISPLQTAVMLSSIANGGYVYKPKLIKDEKSLLINKIFMPSEIRNIILEGMDLVVSSDKGSARPNAIKKFISKPKEISEYKAMFHQFVGKTSTAEFMSNLSFNPSSKAIKYKNIWFGAISFEDPGYEVTDYNKKSVWKKPELVVVVVLNYGDNGKEAAPLAYKIVKKYRELKEKLN